MNLEYKRLKFKARRGMLELDLVLQRYLDNNFSNMNAELIKQFESFMELTDPELLDILVNEVNIKNTDYTKYEAIINDVINNK